MLSKRLKNDFSKLSLMPALLLPLSLLVIIVLVSALPIVNSSQLPYGHVESSSSIWNVTLYDGSCNRYNGFAALGDYIIFENGVKIAVQWWSALTVSESVHFPVSPSPPYPLGVWLVWGSNTLSMWLHQDSAGCYYGALVDATFQNSFQVTQEGTGNVCSWQMCTESEVKVPAL